MLYYQVYECFVLFKLVLCPCLEFICTINAEIISFKALHFFDGYGAKRMPEIHPVFSAYHLKTGLKYARRIEYYLIQKSLMFKI
jgi:hypothetical protein